MTLLLIAHGLALLAVPRLASAARRVPAEEWVRRSTTASHGGFASCKPRSF